jgi:HlyD family secretion protein
MVNPVQPILVLSDLTALEVDVNLDETDVTHVALAQEAHVSVDAFPGVAMVGEVTYVAPKADTFSGVVLYPVTVRLMVSDLPLRAGMTADVEITTASQEGALIVPLRAVHTEDGHAYVDRLGDDGMERVEVTLGLTTDTEAEIAGGLAAGDVVAVVSGATRDSGIQMPGPMGRFVGGD